MADAMPMPDARWTDGGQVRERHCLPVVECDFASLL